MSSQTPRRSPRHLAGALGALILGAATLTGCDPGGSATTPTTTLPAGPSTTTTSTPRTSTEPAQTEPAQTEPIAPLPSTVAQPAPNASSCGQDDYVNVDGRCVHRPVSAPAAPAGATAQCADGTYSSSKHRQGTCSGHGGVSRWL